MKMINYCFIAYPYDNLDALKLVTFAKFFSLNQPLPSKATFYNYF